jgi:hypothetical protein
MCPHSKKELIEPVSSRIVDGMNFPSRSRPDENFGMLVSSGKSLMAMVVTKWNRRSLYSVSPSPHCLMDLLPNVTAIAIQDDDLVAFAFEADSVQIRVSGWGIISIPLSAGLKAVEMHFINPTTLVAVLVGESSELTLPVRSVVTIKLMGKKPTVLTTFVDMICRRSSMAWGCGMLALGEMDGDVYLFDVCGEPLCCRRVTGLGTGPVSAVSFDQKTRVVYSAQGADLYRTRLESFQGCSTKPLFSADGPIRFLHGTSEAVVVLVGTSAEGPAITAFPLLVPLSGAVRTLRMQTRGTQTYVTGITGHGESVAITQINVDEKIFQLVLFDVHCRKRKRAKHADCSTLR